MKNLNLIVNQNEISQNGNEYLTSGGYKSIQCNFSFSEEWNNLTKTAIFLYNGVAYNETLIDDKCFIPHEAIENKGELSIGVFGTEILGENLEKRNTTDLLNVKIYEGSFIKGIQPEKPSPETWELYLEQVNKLIEEATNKIDSFTAENIKFEDGETFQEKYDNGEFSGTSEDLMKKTIYDTNDNGIVDNSEKVNGHTVESDVPANAIFTDTTYDIATKTNDGLMSASDKQKLDGQVAELDEYGKVLSSQLPSYVDDVVEATLATFPESGESGKIYVDIETNLSYRWTGTAYTVISPSIALGETSSTAYRGDRGKIAYEHSQEAHAPINAQENIIENIKLDGIDLQVENKEINLNLEDNLVCVNSTEPTDNRKKVWLQKNKNLFNKNNFLPNSSTSAEGVLISNNSTNTYYIPVEYGNSYIMSFVNNGVSGNVLYGFCDTQPSLGVSCTYNVATADKLNNMKFTPVSENNKYLCIRLRYDDAQIPYMSNIQVEQGTTATSYEENVTSAIYTKESNNKYEKFSETVAISSHQPINQNGLWLQKGKNLFNYETATYLLAYSNSTELVIVASSTDTNHQSSYITCKPNTTYTIEKMVGHSFRVSTTTNVPSVGVAINQTIANHTGSTITITTGENDNYIFFTCFSTYDGDTGEYIDMYKTVKIEEGTSITSNKIYTKNDNGVYEEFINADEVKNDYSLAETKIGTWIDGKPLYRKVLVFSNGTGEATGTTGKIYNLNDFGIANADEIHFVQPSYYMHNGNRIPFPFYDGQTYAIQVYPTQLRIICTYAEIAVNKMVITLQYTKSTDVATTSEE